VSKFNFTSPFVNYLKVNLNLNVDQEAIALYGLQVFTYTFVDFILVILAGWILGCLSATLAVVLTASCLRGVSGGAHSNSPLICALLGMIMSPVLGMLAIKL
jgi:accessory gene regulator B